MSLHAGTAYSGGLGQRGQAHGLHPHEAIMGPSTKAREPQQAVLAEGSQQLACSDAEQQAGAAALLASSDGDSSVEAV
jgi:hypothetical protein